MKKYLLFLLLVASPSLSSLAQTTCITVTDGKHLLPGRIDLAQLEQQANRWTIFVVQSGSIVPTWTLWWSWPHVGPPPFPLSLGSRQGCVLNCQGSLTICFTNRPPPSSPLSLPAGYSLLCCESNVPATFEDIVGRSPDPGTRLYRYIDLPGNDPSVLNETNFLIYTFTDGAWVPETPVVEFSEAVWIFQPPTFSNIQVSAGQFSFDVLTPVATVTVEYTQDLAGGGSWSELTSFSGSGGVMNVVDPAGVDVVTQRFYRVNLHQ